jgi:hypothetical protein
MRNSAPLVHGKVTSVTTEECGLKNPDLTGATKSNRMYGFIESDEGKSYGWSIVGGHYMCTHGKVAGTSNGCLAAARLARIFGIAVPKDGIRLLRQPSPEELPEAMRLADAITSKAMAKSATLLGRDVMFEPIEENDAGYPEAARWSTASLGHVPMPDADAILAQYGIATGDTVEVPVEVPAAFSKSTSGEYTVDGEPVDEDDPFPF